MGRLKGVINLKTLSVQNIVDNQTNKLFYDNSKNYAIIFDGKFYNYKDYKKELSEDGINLVTQTETEIILYLLIKYDTKIIDKINGSFVFVFYDFLKKRCIIARDKYGIKPFFYYFNEKKFYFASELKKILEYDIPKQLNYEAMKSYFQLNYIPNNQCIIKGVKKLRPASYLLINGDGIKNEIYYQIPSPPRSLHDSTYEETCYILKNLLNEAVKIRLEAETPVGCFLSGGIDSSIITALAAQNSKNINTFSIGFSDNQYFDETNIAEIVAKKFNTNHTVFKVSNNDLLSNIHNILNSFDEPFADSSALAIYILNKLTSQKVDIVLSGDAADEMFAGYNKHKAHYKVINAGTKEKLVANLNFLWKILPKSRNSKITNTFRQLYRFSKNYNLTPQERYWNWASIGNEQYVDSLLLTKADETEYKNLKTEYLNLDFTDINEVLYADMQLVLSGDMLVKTDTMSAPNSLEIRTPFLDHKVVDFAFSLPSNYKIDKNFRKKILRDTFKNLLPNEVLSQPKHGFEVPLLKLLQNDFNSLINKDLMSDNFIKEQKIFNLEKIKNLKKQLHSNNPDDSAAKIWAILVFQYFFINYKNELAIS